MQQEILVILRNSFTNRQMDMNNGEQNRNLTPEEKLEEAYANGSLKSFLPEIFQHSEPKVHLWQMHSDFSFLQLELGGESLEIDLHYSITPHYFLVTQSYN